MACIALFCGTVSSASFGQGSPFVWGIGQDLPGPSTAEYTQVDTGADYYMALHVDSSIEVWGSDYGFVVSQAPQGVGFKAISGGKYHALALRTNGTISAWGTDLNLEVSSTPTGNGFKQVAAGNAISFALRSDGSLRGWGYDGQGQVSGVPSGTDFVQVAAGAQHALALHSDGSISSWGDDSLGLVSGTPTGTGFVEVAATTSASLALRTDGSIVAWGDNSTIVADAPLDADFIQVSSGINNVAALRRDGSILIWGGDNGYLQLTQAPLGGSFSQVVVGENGAIALYGGASGSPYCLGDGSGHICPCLGHGQLGEGCANSTVTGGAKLRGSGIPRLTLDTFRLHVDGAPDSTLGLILRGRAQLNEGLGVPLGDGLLCTGGQIARSQVQLTTGGSTVFSLFQGAGFGASSYGIGVRANYQFWYRDSGNTCSGTGANLSNAWTVIWGF